MDTATLIKQGAEARVFEIKPFLSNQNGCIVKERFSKTYRHPVLDKQLTQKRVTQEARCLFRCKKASIDTPALYMVDAEAATIYMERVIGRTLKDIIVENKADKEKLADAIGIALSKMHTVDVVHGDLTTSNLMLRDDNESLVIIDFGLSYVSKLPEDKAVDLYVLERAFTSTHPNSEAMFESILQSYKKHNKQSKPTLNKLEEAPRARFYSTNTVGRSRSTNPFLIGAGLGLLITAGGVVHNEASDWIPWKKSSVDHAKLNEAKAAHEKQDPNITTTTWEQQNQVNRGLNEPGLFIWGSNRNKIIDASSSKQSFPYPHLHQFFQGRYLRDVAFGPDHAVAVDHDGNIYQWGSGYGEEQPQLTLQHGNIVQVTASQSMVYALSKSGVVYALPSLASVQQELANRKLPKSLRKTESSWLSWILGGSKVVNEKGYAYAVPMDQDVLKSGERITSISSGLHHVVAVTSSGRVFAAPTDSKGNEKGQLGMGHVTAIGPSEFGYTKWYVVENTLSDIKAVQIATGDNHSVVRSGDGRVYTFGANNYGQLAQGDISEAKGQCNYPLEVSLLYSTSGRASKPPGHSCSHIAAGGSNSYFVVNKVDKSKQHVTEVYAAGMGQYGQLGNATYSQMQMSPVKVKEISNNMEFDEKLAQVVPIRILDVVAGTTHAFGVLDNVTNVDESQVDTSKPNFGHDVYSWGHNYDYQVGNGKRNNISHPISPETLDAEQAGREGSNLNRLQLAPLTHVKAKLPDSNKEKTLEVDQKLVAGPGISAVYSRVR